MINNFGFRINKYIKIAIIIGIIDISLLYIVGEISECSNLFSNIISNFKHISLFIGIITILVYLIDVTFFYNRNKKYKMLLIFKEPFSVWYKYIYPKNKINQKDLVLNFYNDMYKPVRDNEKIKGIMEDEILIRDLNIHYDLTNILLLIVFFVLEKTGQNFIYYFIVIYILVAILLNILYRQYLKYYLTEIYTEYKRTKKVK